MANIIPAERIEKAIYLIRGRKVMIDRDLAELYQVETKVLNQAVKRNQDRFPEGFMFQLSKKEKAEVVTICDHLKELKYSYRLPYVFTEQGVAMLSSVLNSKRAIQVNILIINTFVKLRELVSSHKDVLRKIEELEGKYDKQFKIVFDAIRALIIPTERSKKRIGFMVD
ncbi:MAG: ORF6N domain-containing protein [Candidatus Margulisiibacteriota bacterium]